MIWHAVVCEWLSQSQFFICGFGTSVAIAVTPVFLGSTRTCAIAQLPPSDFPLRRLMEVRLRSTRHARSPNYHPQIFP